MFEPIVNSFTANLNLRVTFPVLINYTSSPHWRVDAACGHTHVFRVPQLADWGHAQVFVVTAPEGGTGQPSCVVGLFTVWQAVLFEGINVQAFRNNPTGLAFRLPPEIAADRRPFPPAVET